MSTENGDETVTITLSILNVVLIIASVLYIWCLVLGCRKIESLQRIHPHYLGLKKMLIVSIIVICVIRIMTFVGVTAMDIANVRAHYSPSYFGGNDDAAFRTTNNATSTSSSINTRSHNVMSPLLRRLSSERSSNKSNQIFYDSSMTVLFDLPNAIVVSTFVLLTLVWAECFLQARLHTESMTQWKKQWLMGYTIFNSCLFFGQIILYILVFSLSGSDSAVQVVKEVVYTGMIATNLAACTFAAFAYIFLNVRFAGFPFKSSGAKGALTKISIVFSFWTISRFIWSIANIFVFANRTELLHDSNDPIFSALLLFFSLLCCEILPMMIMLDYSYVQIVSFETYYNTVSPISASESEVMMNSGTTGMEELE